MDSFRIFSICIANVLIKEGRLMKTKNTGMFQVDKGNRTDIAEALKKDFWLSQWQSAAVAEFLVSNCGILQKMRLS